MRPRRHGRSPGEAADPTRGEDAASTPGTEALLRAAVALWRAQRTLDANDGTPTAADLRQVRRQLNIGRQALADDGLEIQEHDGQPFDSGLSLEVLAFQEEPDLTREVVLETVRPSVYLGGRRVQMGQVIVGRPAPRPDDDPGTRPEDPDS
ncbi:hypothetical protein [Streptomyces triticirhizae]|uniref:hypothetical protein n=1 Tax=Streptomyces triticirhizae TaxID=2483353 RepID=UPI001F2A970A|nr:hypothetical protein [Streptomyces triticirhizae]